MCGCRWRFATGCCGAGCGGAGQLPCGGHFESCRHWSCARPKPPRRFTVWRSPSQFVNFCGKGVFVETRGGSADHAAMKYGPRYDQSRQVPQFELWNKSHFPTRTPGRSAIRYAGEEGRRRTHRVHFTRRLVCLGCRIGADAVSPYAALIRFVRDIDGDVPARPPRRSTRSCSALPESMTAQQVRRMFSTHGILADVAHISSVSKATGLSVRGVMCSAFRMLRGHANGLVPQRADMVALGQLMKISHDGRTVFQCKTDLRQLPSY